MRARFSDDDWELQADMMEYTELFLRGVQEIAAQLDRGGLNRLIDVLTKVRENSGRVFFLGVGGSAANASHAVNDFRKIAGIECYAPSDNISELTARINDDGWESSYSNWLRVSRLNVQDAIFVFSVGGGNVEQAVSINIVRSLELARRVGASILGVVGRDGGYTAKVADACVIIPTFSEEMVTPLVEAFQAVVWHMLVSHPKLKMNEARWESTLALA
jgi:D-sedoheptulose 7-phosphate isomerase